MLKTKEFMIMRTADAKDLTYPARATECSAGLDLHANITEPITLHQFEKAVISAGIKMIIPMNHEIQIRSRSGSAAKHGIKVMGEVLDVLNDPATIDEDYRGELKVILMNFDPTPYTINRNDKIAQVVLSPVSYQNPMEPDERTFELFTTARGEGGLGSTGV